MVGGVALFDDGDGGVYGVSDWHDFRGFYVGLRVMRGGDVFVAIADIPDHIARGGLVLQALQGKEERLGVGFGFADILAENCDGEIFIQAEFLDDIRTVTLAQTVADQGHWRAVLFEEGEHGIYARAGLHEEFDIFAAELVDCFMDDDGFWRFYGLVGLGEDDWALRAALKEPHPQARNLEGRVV